MKKYVVEAIGTFFFVLCIGLAVRFSGSLAPLVIGAALMVLVYAGAYISGGHYNPAVTLGLATSGKFSWSQVLPYWISQLVGAIIWGRLVSRFLSGYLTPLSLDPSAVKVIVAELLFTFALVYVVHHVAAAESNSNNSFYGLAIGFTVLVGGYVVGTYSGGAFNPAVVIGSYFNGLFTFDTAWQHLVGQLIGAILAGLCCKALASEWNMYDLPVKSRVRVKR